MKKLLLKQKPMASIGKAEMKIFVIMCYYMLLGIILLSAFTYNHAAVEEGVIEFRTYFCCQSAGIQSGRDCGDSPEVHQQMLRGLLLVGRFLQCLFPIVVLTFVMDWKCNRSSMCLKKTRKTDLIG